MWPKCPCKGDRAAGVIFTTLASGTSQDLLFQLVKDLEGIWFK